MLLLLEYLKINMDLIPKLLCKTGNDFRFDTKVNAFENTRQKIFLSKKKLSWSISWEWIILINWIGFLLPWQDLLESQSDQKVLKS